MDSRVLVLNQNYEPLNICNVRRAFVLVFRGKAEVLESLSEPLISVSELYPRPSVIKLMYMIKRPRLMVRLSRRDVFLRDSYTCQYCGYEGRDMTVDHVIPRQRGGVHSWDNVVTACRGCNHRKGAKNPKDAHMALIRRPRSPSPLHYFWWQHQGINGTANGWQKFLVEPK